MRQSNRQNEWSNCHRYKANGTVKSTRQKSRLKPVMFRKSYARWQRSDWLSHEFANTIVVPVIPFRNRLRIHVQGTAFRPEWQCDRSGDHITLQLDLKGTTLTPLLGLQIDRPCLLPGKARRGAESRAIRRLMDSDSSVGQWFNPSEVTGQK